MQQNLHLPDRLTWDDYFMSLACLASMRSPDNETKHGCILVDSHNRIIGTGYNGFPRGEINPYPTNRPDKYTFILHAEQNSILNAIIPAQISSSITAYVTGLPCPRCMIVLVQFGVKSVVYGKIQSSMVDEVASMQTHMIASNHTVSIQEYQGSPSVSFEKTIDYLKLKEWI